MCVVSTPLSCSPPCLPSLAAPRSLLSRQSVTRSPECWSNPSPGHVTTQLQPGHSPQLQPGQRIPSRAELSRAHIVLLQIFVSRAATILTRTRTQGWVRSRWNKIFILQFKSDKNTAFNFVSIFNGWTMSVMLMLSPKNKNLFIIIIINICYIASDRVWLRLTGATLQKKKFFAPQKSHL